MSMSKLLRIYKKRIGLQIENKARFYYCFVVSLLNSSLRS